MNTFIRSILVGPIISCLLVACVTQRPVRLTPAEATRLADIKARSAGYDPKDYKRELAIYDESDESWWTSYVPKGAKRVEFNVRVDSKTRESWLVLR